ncbi:terminase family protein [Sphingobium sufflavum]|uniref:DNA-packaging protein n=1 Tax=Sphingobium sufflavum TaxID=1129547 RepID=UPI001F2F4FF8|nr:terminase family protein [Sphingobium sufflavum]MCE7798660.1 terminase family protein [Sphingobium sufflavum]
MGREAPRSDYERVAAASPEERAMLLRLLGADAMTRLATRWQHRARPAQLPPPGAWSLWLVMAGRGFGKTRLGAEWVRAVAEADGSARIALIGASLHDARAVMVEGESGLLAIAPPWARPLWQPSRRQLRWPNGARATLFGAGEPDALRGPQHSHVWGDEIAKWPDGLAVWDNAMMGLRLGHAPRALATTTPRPVPLLRKLLEQPGVVVTRGRTADNRGALPAAFLAAMARDYGGTRLGRQELEGEMLLDLEGALWTRDLLDRCRVRRVAAEGGDMNMGAEPLLRRVVVGVDPPASATGDACGIIVAGIGPDGRGHVIDDASVERATPEVWARAVARAHHRWGADRVVAEANNGGAMVESVLRAADAGLPVRLVHASRGKVARAEPVATLYEAGRVVHAGLFPLLEDEMCGMVAGGGYAGPGRSPDRADALVWALTDLLLGRMAQPGFKLL